MKKKFKNKLPVEKLSSEERKTIKNEVSFLLEKINDIYKNIDQLTVRDVFFVNFGDYKKGEDNIEAEIKLKNIDTSFFYKGSKYYDLIFLYSYKGVELNDVYTVYNIDSQATFYNGQIKNGIKIRAYECINFINDKNSYFDFYSPKINFLINKNISNYFKKNINELSENNVEILKSHLNKIDSIEIRDEEHQSMIAFLISLQKELMNSNQLFIPLKDDLKNRLEFWQIINDHFDFSHLIPKSKITNNKIKMDLK